MTADRKQAIANIDSIVNARDLGGYPVKNGKRVKSGLLLRSAALNGMSENDRQTLQNLNLSLVIDFRDQFEIDGSPDPEMEGVRQVHLSPADLQKDPGLRNITSSAVLLDFCPEAIQRMFESLQSFSITSLYRSFLLEDKGKAGYREFFKLLLAQPDDEAVLWHCSFGKDRAGLAAALLLSVLGADRKTILDDYELSNEYLSDQNEDLSGMAEMLADHPEVLNVLSTIYGVQRETLNKTFRLKCINFLCQNGEIVESLLHSISRCCEILLLKSVVGLCLVKILR
ncbi:MAG: tyrosine-protein phosphatase, partial [Erysipelotrichaceae bacterium]|nr:tyrosine-protein phosphatase [Erysipelotrichaceae bacterium]